LKAFSSSGRFLKSGARVLKISLLACSNSGSETVEWV